MRDGRFPRALTLLATSALVACAGPAAPDQAPPAAPGLLAAAPAAPAPVDYVYDPDSRVLMAYSDARTRPALKGDQYDDIRAAHPERYVVTTPPANIATVRPMVEWEPMSAIVMSFPAYMDSSDNAASTFANIAKHAATVAEVWFIVDGNQAKSLLNQRMLGVGMTQATIDAKVRYTTADIDSVWFIDSGPLPILDKSNGTFAFADFRYYHERAYDDGVPTVLGRALPSLGQASAVPTYRMPLNVEGGTFQATSDGVCFTGGRQLYYMSCDSGGCDNSLLTMPIAQLQSTSQAQEVKQIWAEYLGCKDVIFTHGITDDGTGHIDMYMKVVDDDTIIMGDYPTPYANTAQQTNGPRLDGNADFLEAYVKPGGGGFTVERVVMPGHRNTSQGEVPFTYINSTFINGLNLWPAYTFSNWTGSRAQAQGQWEAIMPTYEHIWIDAEELSFWSGAIHCITRTIPDATPALWVADGACSGGTCSAPTGGYAGDCQPGANTSDVCWGPAWDGTLPTSDCGDVSYEGCCTGTQLTFCESGALSSYDCPSGCGWSGGGGFYDCAGGQSAAQPGAADPSGTYPRSCQPVTCTPSCSGKACGDDGCGGSCGSCGAGASCQAGQCVGGCAPDCSGKACGADGCGGSCGSCGAGKVCDAVGQCVDDGGSGTPDCATLPAEGECQGATVYWCEAGALQSFDCAAQGKVCGLKPGVGNTCVDAVGPGEDVGPATPDAGGSSDSGGAGADAGPSADVTVKGDAAVGVDTGVPLAPVTGGGGVSGCASTAPASRPPVALGLLALLGLALVVRRRRV